MTYYNNNDLYGREVGRKRTDIYCHSCSKTFYAVIDFNLDGNHEIECPACGHIHYRRINRGIVTDDRYCSDGSTTHVVTDRTLWKATTQPIITSTASSFIRDRWFNTFNRMGDADADGDASN